MMIDEIIHGESRNVEFKVKLPDISEKYTKTIIAFANSQGGRLIVGVDDTSRRVVGVDNDVVFKIMTVLQMQYLIPVCRRLFPI